jgi:membrane-bound inhibitor of C-type lysozyme
MVPETIGYHGSFGSGRENLTVTSSSAWVATAAARSFFARATEIAFATVHPPTAVGVPRGIAQAAVRAATSPAFAVILLACAAAGCVTPSKPPGDRYVRYRCADGQEFGVTFQQQGKRALLEAGGWSHLLVSVPTGSGAKYGDGKIMLSIKGAEAAVEENGRLAFRDCHTRGGR